MISKKIQELINKQINAELWAAFLYLSMSVDARHKGTCGIAHWLFIQAREELDHSRIFQNYLIAQGVKVKLCALEAVPNEWDNPLMFFKDALQHEQKITNMIHNIAKEAQAEQDYATINMLSWFIDEQIEEEENCTTLIQKFSAAKNDPCMLFQLDQALLKRKYEMPKHHHAEHWIA